jgi:hypothetical protein
VSSDSKPTCPYPLDKCRHPGCRKPIFWATNDRTGKSMPIDPQPHADGNVRIQPPSFDGAAPVAVVLTTAERFGKTGLYLSHLATCEFADTFRRTIKRRRTS